MTAEPIPVTRFLALLGAVTKQDVDQALASLAQDYEQEGRGLQLAEVAGGYRIVTKAEFAPWLKRLEKVKSPSKLSRSALESLAIIAYKQPIVRAEVEQIRGVETSGVIRTLLERKLVRIVGRKEEPGRPIMYGTTKFSSNILGCAIYLSCRRFVSSNSWANLSRRCCRLMRSWQLMESP